ncbi:GNAT family N-acetyltransferase [Roseivirga sp. E12]|uniref:GNAT family N-acetyltransferase n=1 Tax=Roseivirga sp. E12 TaxID=2819237 RepID=UPI001ABC0C3D|nr:GNAT family N-acetyltransferase [Roseivirga sp. E12]MBO3697686.1 GNAT family N-acetyltransferase [Roseivirga sp. E12]
MSFAILQVKKEEYPEIVEVWEASVRATHDFLRAEDIQYFKPLILNTYLDAVDLRCIKDSKGKILGFLGVVDQSIEMLFLHPDAIGKGIGRQLLNYAIETFGANKVDVNEQNPEAVKFYQHCGFRVVSRSPLDPLGKPYPILHLSL